MNPLIRLKTTPSLLITLTLLCFAPLPKVQAVVPPPDGGYPGFNTAEGQNALFSLTTGSANTAVGWFSLSSDTTGSFNTATGAGALLFNTGNANTAFGAAALLFNTIGFDNTAVGAAALLNNATGNNNTATGFVALQNNTTGSDNTANGLNALSHNTTGTLNTAVGEGALLNNTTGSVNTAVGAGAGFDVTTADNVICIGVGVTGADVSNTTWIGGIFGTTTQSGTTTPVIVSDSGQLGTVASSERFKKEIKPMDHSSEAILALRPVTFHYKTDTANRPQFGLVAEEVEKINPDLVVRDKEGKPYSVRYDQVNAMLLNEFLKEHCKNEEQAATIARLQQQIEALTAGLQKVSAQVEMSKPAQQTVAER